MEQLKTIKFKGKDYAEVHTRVNYFRSSEQYKDWGEECEIVERADDWSWVLMKVIIRYPDERIASTGHAFEEKDANHINTRNHVENCETSALGRALGKLGIGSDGSIATYEEVQNAIANESNDKAKAETKQEEVKEEKKQTPDEYILETDNWEKVLRYMATNKDKMSLAEMIKEFEDKKYGKLQKKTHDKLKKAYDKK
jgi:hypothetical protein